MTEKAPFLTIPAEVRNRISHFVALGSRRWIPTQDRIQTSNVSNTSSVDASNAAAFPWQLAATCKQLHSEYLPILYSNTDIYIYGITSSYLDIHRAIKPPFTFGIRYLCLLNEMELGIRVQDFPTLETFEYVTAAVDWVPGNDKDITDLIEATIDGSGLIKGVGEYAIAKSRLLSDLLLPAGDTAHLEFIVSVPVCASLESKYDYVIAMGEHGNYIRENIDVAFVR
jgi:hypothetical protein